MLYTEVKVSRNGPERRSGKRIIAGTAFRLEFLVGWYYDADATRRYLNFTRNSFYILFPEQGIT